MQLPKSPTLKKLLTGWLLLASLLPFVPCMADDSSFSMSGDDSMLPPEVIPLDAAAASKMLQSQAVATPQSTAYSAGRTPVSPQSSLSASAQTAQEFRRKALDSLMNQAQPGFKSGMVTAGGNPVLSQNTLGQSPLINPNAAGATGASNNQLGQSPWIRPGQTLASNGVSNPSQSQTLSGGVKTQRVQHDTRRSGFSNAFSAMTGFAAGALVGGMLRRPNSLMGLGMFGLGSSGFGIRNGFRW